MSRDDDQSLESFLRGITLSKDQVMGMPKGPRRTPEKAEAERRRVDQLEAQRLAHKSKIQDDVRKVLAPIREVLEEAVDWFGLRLDGASQQKQDAAWESLVLKCVRFQPDLKAALEALDDVVPFERRPM